MQIDRFYVYQHRRHDTGAIFYVGKGQGRRAWASDKHHRGDHWRHIVAKVGGISVEVLAKGLPDDLALLAEVERIDQLRRLGVDLCNQTDGGDGTSGWVRTPEWRAKISAAHRGKVMSAETRAKLSASVKATGYRHSEEVCNRMSASRMGLQNTLGMKHSDSARRLISEAAKGNRSRTGQVRSEAERAKHSAAMKGVPQARLTCPHCGRDGGNAMRRWHFDACKVKP